MLDMNKKIENLRNLLNGREVRYEELERICYRNESVPSVQSLRKYGLLVKRVERWEDVMDDEEWENRDEYDDMYEDYHWDDDRQLWVSEEYEVWYSVK